MKEKLVRKMRRKARTILSTCRANNFKHTQQWANPSFVCVCEFIAVCVDLVPVGATQIFLGEPIAPVEKVGEARRHNGLHDTTDELNMLIYESFVGCGERREQSAGLGKAIRHHRSFELTKDAVAGGKSV